MDTTAMPMTPAAMPTMPSSAPMATATAIPVTPAASPMPTTTEPLPVRPDLRENKTSFDPTPSTDMGMTPPPAGLPKKKGNLSKIIGVAVLLLLVIGGGAGFYLSQKNSDIRQQASTGVVTPGCNTTCQNNLECPAAHTCSQNKCVLSACLVSGTSCDTNKCVITSSAACALNFVATSPESLTCDKVAYQDELSNSAGSYTLTTQKSTFSPSDVVVYKVTLTNNGAAGSQISLADILADSGTNNLGKVTFMDSDCGASAYNATTKTLTCPAAPVGAGASVSHIFRVKLDAAISDGTSITNSAIASAESVNASCSVAVTVSNPSNPTYSCNSDCTSDAQCKTANDNYTCSGNKCRLSTNTSSTTCTPAETVTYACNSSCTTDAQCQTANSAYTCSSGSCRLGSNTSSTTCSPASVTYACNSDCSTDAQCQSVNGSYTCDAANGNKCRLDSNRSSTTCEVPTNTYACNSSCTTDAQCQTANGSYVCSNNLCRLSSNTSADNCQPATVVVVTPTVGCNESCTQNADCASSNHVCVQTSNGQRCRLDNYPNSESCLPPSQTTTTTVYVTPTPGTTTVAASTPQPEKPATLPRTGSTETTVRFLLMGAGAVVLGALGLLLL